MRRIADFIEQNRELLVQRFLEEVGKLESARGLRPAEIINALPEYLATLAALSREGSRPEPMATRRPDEALRERSRFEQQLIGIVSHDLRNPLTTILLGTKALLRSDELNERGTRSILRIQTAAERASRMVRDLLDFTQARLGGGLRLRRMPGDLHETVAAVVEEVRAAHPERELRVECYGDGLGEWDEDRLSQLVTNLLTNAVKYSPAGTTVSLRTVGDGQEVTLEVHNEGPPIPADLLPVLFQPLQRGGGGNSSTERSVGLGLYIVDQVVRAHRGSLDVRSTQDAGTTFTVRLPRRAPPVPGS
jgi:signal transduction histidine kinase